jgi:uncharacterized membrane protein YbaN (DUF454 family)
MATSILSSLRKGIYIIVGTLALAIGIIGIFLPVVPTTPLVLLSAACYLRGSEKLHRWILSNPRFGEIIENYESGKGLKRSIKIKAIGLMWIMILISAFYFVESLIARIAMILISSLVTIYLIRLPTIVEPVKQVL